MRIRHPLHIPFVAVFTLYLSTIAALADITGQYFAYGRNADGSAYQGLVSVLANGDGTFAVNWQVGSTYSGVGRMEGRVLEVEWGDTTPATYVLMPDGELHGTWGDGTGLEIWAIEAR